VHHGGGRGQGCRPGKSAPRGSQFFCPDPFVVEFHLVFERQFRARQEADRDLAVIPCGKPEVDASRKLVDMSFSPTLAGRDLRRACYSHHGRLSSPAAAPPHRDWPKAHTGSFLGTEEKAASVPGNSPRHENILGAGTGEFVPLARKTVGNVQQ